MNDQALYQDKGLQIPDLTKQARRKRWLWAVVTIAAIGAAIAFYARPRVEPDLYRFDRVERRSLVQLVDTSGNLDVRRRVEVPAPLAGRLTSIAVKPRQEVQQGQLLATLDERAGTLAVRTAEVNVEAASGRARQADIALAAARKTADRVQRLRERGLASQQELLEAENAVDQGKAVKLAAGADGKLAAENLAAARLQRSLTQIVAPEAGVVLRVPADIGAAVAPEREPLFVIAAPLDVMKVDAFVSETEIASVVKGHKAEVLVQALPGRTFEATVDQIGLEPRRDGGVVMYPIALLVDNPDFALMPGMSARVRMEVARADGVLSVHEAALRFVLDDATSQPGPPHIYRRNGGPNRLEPVEVKTGISDGVYIAIEAVNGAQLAPGDDIAIGWLRPGTSNKPNVSLGKR